MEYDTPVPCPVCDGTGVYYTKTKPPRERICTACEGSCVLYLTRQQYLKRIGDMEGAVTRKPWTTRELLLLRPYADADMGRVRLAEAGFFRTLAAVAMKIWRRDHD